MTKSKRISAMRKNIISSLFELTSFHKRILYEASFDANSFWSAFEYFNL